MNSPKVGDRMKVKFAPWGWRQERGNSVGVVIEKEFVNPTLPYNLQLVYWLRFDNGAVIGFNRYELEREGASDDIPD